MKEVRRECDGFRFFNDANYDQWLADSFVTCDCEEGELREIESGEIRNGKLHVTLKGRKWNIPQRLLGMIDPSVVNGGTRLVMICEDGSWAVKDIARGVDGKPVDLWGGGYAAQDNGDHIVRSEDSGSSV